MTFDVYAKEWIAVRDFARAEIAAATSILIEPGHDPLEYERQRGRIAFANELLALPTRRQQPPAAP